MNGFQAATEGLTCTAQMMQQQLWAQQQAAGWREGGIFWAGDSDGVDGAHKHTLHGSGAHDGVVSLGMGVGRSAVVVVVVDKRSTLSLSEGERERGLAGTEGQHPAPK
jgi:hypothetical protein